MIVDASVAVKWILPEADSGMAQSLLLRAVSIYAPVFMQYELASALTKNCRMKLIDHTTADAAFAKWQHHVAIKNITLLDYDGIADHAYQLSMQLSHAVQDCVYLALSLWKNLPMVTADKIFAGKATPLYKNVHLLSEFTIH